MLDMMMLLRYKLNIVKYGRKLGLIFNYIVSTFKLQMMKTDVNVVDHS